MRFPLPRAGGLLLAAMLASAAAPMPPRPPDEAAAYKALTGDDLPTGELPPLAIAAWAGGAPGMIIVATLEGDGDASDDLGGLRVGILARQGAAWRVVGSNDDSGESDLKRTIEPSTASLRIDPVAFRIAPREVAVAVDVSETLTTSSTSAEASTLHLYRRVGPKLSPIFATSTEDATLDKAGSDHEVSRRWIVRFKPHLTNGFYDLVVAQRNRRAARTYTWSGLRYLLARR